MNVLIYPNFEKKNAFDTTLKTIDILSDMNFGIYMDLSYKVKFQNEKVTFDNIDNIVKSIEIIIVIGGDGTILKASKIAANYDKALLGINTGNLGFMASLEIDSLQKLTQLKSGDYKINKRLMLKVVLEENNTKQEYLALNDAVISRMPQGDLPEFSILSNSKEVSTIRSDGVIFSTPTGSTAYALSAGGPIIEPDVSCIEVTQNCAHSLFSRPMIFSAEKILTVKMKVENNEELSLVVDGKTVATLNSDSVVYISASKLTTKIIDINDSAFYKAIDKKLMKPIK